MPKKTLLIRRARLALTLLLAVASLAACASPPAPPLDTGMLVFWRIERADGTGGSAHLLGTMHLAKEALALDPAIEAARAAADEIVLEVAPAELTPHAVISVIAERGRAPAGKTFRDFVSAETARAVDSALRERKLPIAEWEAFEPWVVTFMLTSDQLASEGFSQEAGVEHALIASAATASKPTRGLETVREQLERLDALPLATQELLLRDAATGGERVGSVDLLASAWQRGDLEALAREVFASPSGPGAAEFFEAIYFARNRAFADEIAALVDGGGRWFVAIGAGHMVGEQGIPQLLAARGYRVERIAKTDTAAHAKAPRSSKE